MIKEKLHAIFGEMESVLGRTNQSQVDALVADILGARTIVVCGAGRVGMAIRGLGMRLGHLGLRAYALGDATVPSIGPGDLLLTASGSGETQTVYDLVEIAKKNGARVALVTGNTESRMGQLADTTVVIQAPSKTKPVADVVSIQPMTTLNEQCLGVFFDALVLELMDRTGETHDTMWARHSNLE